MRGTEGKQFLLEHIAALASRMDQLYRMASNLPAETEPWIREQYVADGLLTLSLGSVNRSLDSVEKFLQRSKAEADVLAAEAWLREATEKAEKLRGLS